MKPFILNSYENLSNFWDAVHAMVAYVYGLTQDEFEYILSTFTTSKNQERLQTLKKYALEAFKKDQFLKESA